jgi:predicted nucleotidyltransferase
MTTSFIERKINCSKEFVEILAQRLKERLFKVVLFGSVAKGSGNADSDIDLLVVVDQITNDIRKAVAETAFEASIRSGEPIDQQKPMQMK